MDLDQLDRELLATCLLVTILSTNGDPRLSLAIARLATKLGVADEVRRTSLDSLAQLAERN